MGVLNLLIVATPSLFSLFIQVCLTLSLNLFVEAVDSFSLEFFLGLGQLQLRLFIFLPAGFEGDDGRCRVLSLSRGLTLRATVLRASSLFAKGVSTDLLPYYVHFSVRELDRFILG